MSDLSPMPRAVHGARLSPRVSVIMPFLDVERYISEAIASVLGQTLADWELLLVDDGSTDESRAIAARYAREDPDRIRLLNHPGRVNRGTAASRNLGMAEAQGEYIAFLDADDIFDRKRLQHHARLLDADPGLGLVIGADLYWYSWTRDQTGPQDIPDHVVGPPVMSERRYEPPALLAAILLTPNASMPTVCGVTVRRAAVAEVGPIPKEFTDHYEDQVLFCKLLLEHPAWVSGKVLARYRQRAGSITEGNSSLFNGPGSPAMAARERFLGWFGQYLRDTCRDLPDLMKWSESELARIHAASQVVETRVHVESIRKRAMAAARRALPAWLSDPIFLGFHALDARLARRRAMRVIEGYEGDQAVGSSLSEHGHRGG